MHTARLPRVRSGRIGHRAPETRTFRCVHHRASPIRTALALLTVLATLHTTAAFAQSDPSTPQTESGAQASPAPEAPPTDESGSPVLDFTAQGPMTAPTEAPKQPESQDQSVSEPQPSAPEATPVLYGVLAPPPAAVPPPPMPSMPNSLSLSPIGLVIGKVRLNYERRFADRHGLLVEGAVAPSLLSGFDFVSAGGGVGYRWYWNGPESSGFVGCHVGIEQGSGRFDTVVDGETRTYAGRVRQLSIVPVIGKRWLLMPHLVMTLRFGLGYASTRYEPDASADAEAVDQLRDFARQLPITLESEFSLGYRF